MGVGKAFLSMCLAFRTIESQELWKGSHKSFPASLKDRWEMDASRVSHYIKAAEVLEDLKDSEKLPTNEGQCRVLGKLTTEQRQKVWAKVLESDEKPTGRLIKETAKELGFMEKPDGEVEAPPKEVTFISDFAETVNALHSLVEIVGEFDPADIDQVREKIVQCRSALEEIERAIGDGSL